MLLHYLPIVDRNIFNSDCHRDTVHVNQLQFIRPDLLLILGIQEGVLEVLVLPDPEVALKDA